jgi:hypothetical protein
MGCNVNPPLRRTNQTALAPNCAKNPKTNLRNTFRTTSEFDYICRRRSTINRLQIPLLYSSFTAECYALIFGVQADMPSHQGTGETFVTVASLG